MQVGCDGRTRSRSPSNLPSPKSMRGMNVLLKVGCSSK